MRRFLTVTGLTLAVAAVAAPATAAEGTGKAYCGNAGLTTVIECKCTSNCTGATISSRLLAGGSWGFRLTDPGRPARLSVRMVDVANTSQSWFNLEETCSREAKEDQTVVLRLSGSCEVVTKRGNDWGW